MTPDPELALSIETALAACSVALVRSSGEVVAHRHEVIDRGHAERLVPMVGEVLAAAGVQPGRVLVDVGPGSFTGVRIGLAAAQAFALGWRARLHGLSSLHAQAAAAISAGRVMGAFACLIDVGRGQLVHQLVSPDAPGRWRMDGAPTVMACDEARDIIPGGSWVSGSGAAHLDPERWSIAGPDWPDARTSVAAEALFGQAALVAPSPRYARPADAVPLERR